MKKLPPLLLFCLCAILFFASCKRIDQINSPTSVDIVTNPQLSPPRLPDKQSPDENIIDFFHSSLAIDAELMDDGSLFVLYDGSAFPRDKGVSCLVKYNAEFKVVWQTKNIFDFPHTLERQDQSLIISDSENVRLVIFSSDLSQIKSIELSNWDFHVFPNDADFTSDGNIQFADHYTNTIYKIDYNGKILKSVNVAPYCGDAGQLDCPSGTTDSLHDADELPNGNYLYCMSYSNRVLESDSAGNIVWQHTTDLWWPKTVQRLENGNTLIGDKIRVIEVTPQGKIVWQFIPPWGVSFNYKRYPDGNTLIGGPYVALIARDGTIIWELPGCKPLQDDENEETQKMREKLRSVAYL